MRELAIDNLDAVGGGRDDALAVQTLAAAATTATWYGLTDRTDTDALCTAVKGAWIPTAISDLICATGLPGSGALSALSPVGYNYNRWVCAIVGGTVNGVVQFMDDPLGKMLSAISR